MSLPRTGADSGQNRFYPRGTAAAARHTRRPGLRHAGRYPRRPRDPAALMETGIRVSDVEIVRLSPGFTLDDRLQRFMETAARLGAGTGVSRRE